MADMEGPVPELRVGDAERRAAMQALDTHLEAGRLSVDEYGDRSAAAVTAVYRPDLATLFVDLPAPHPSLPRRPGDPVTPVPVSVAGAVSEVDRDHPVRHPGPGAGLALGLMIMLMFALPAMVAAGAAPASGFLLLPLLFLAFGGVARHRGHQHGGRGRRR